jgi:hypothetical protein
MNQTWRCAGRTVEVEAGAPQPGGTVRAAWYDLQGPIAEVLHSAVKVNRNFPQ